MNRNIIMCVPCESPSSCVEMSLHVRCRVQVPVLIQCNRACVLWVGELGYEVLIELCSEENLREQGIDAYFKPRNSLRQILYAPRIHPKG